MANKRVPAFDYTGEYETSADENYWYVTLKTSGAIAFKFPKTIDVFVVGGGGGGGSRMNDDGGGGGGGGYTTTAKRIAVAKGTGYEIVIGRGGTGSSKAYANTYGGTGVSAMDGEQSSAFGFTAEGGKGGTSKLGGDGGCGGGFNGGDGGSNGGDGYGAITETRGPGKGQGMSTRAFSEGVYACYGGGGGGGALRYSASGPGKGGETGGGDGGQAKDGVVSGQNGADNTGGGGGAVGGEADGYGGNGGSGVVIIRGTEQDYVDVYFGGVRLTDVYYNGTRLESWVHNGVKLFFERLRAAIFAGNDMRRATA